MRFVDLFAGLGGFHQALTKLGHECVFASELDTELASLYDLNFGIRPAGDIRHAWNTVPSHDILCAGFPCQPFSKAGDQLGFDCPQWGDLFDYVIKILKRHKPRFLLIENVPNLINHARGRTWEAVLSRLRACGYAVDYAKLSPHLFGVPQLRERAVIVGDRLGLDGFTWPVAKSSSEATSIASILETRPREARHLSASAVQYINAWQTLLDKLPKETALPSFPIWAMEFGATYPFELTTPLASSRLKLARSKGAFGTPFRGMSLDEISSALPTYARSPTDHFPKWKIDFIRQNRQFYAANKATIDAWLPSIREFAPSFQKLEWNWKDGPRDLWQTIIQFRASGIRAKRPNYAPSLVALTTTQIPVISWERRYMTVRECARLQSMGDLPHLPSGLGAAHKALGNAVNVEVIFAVAGALLDVSPSATKAPSLEYAFG